MAAELRRSAVQIPGHRYIMPTTRILKLATMTMVTIDLAIDGNHENTLAKLLTTATKKLPGLSTMSIMPTLWHSYIMAATKNCPTWQQKIAQPLPDNKKVAQQ